MRHDPFLRMIAQRLFAALAQVVPERELDDMAAQWPRQFQPLLNVIRTRRDPSTPQNESSGHVARRESADRDQAERHARAVFAARREVTPRKELYDVESELPREHALLFSVVT